MVKFIINFIEKSIDKWISFHIFYIRCVVRVLIEYSNAWQEFLWIRLAKFVIIWPRIQHYISIRLKSINAKKNLPKLLGTVIIQSKLSCCRNQLNWLKKKKRSKISITSGYFLLATCFHPSLKSALFLFIFHFSPKKNCGL